MEDLILFREVRADLLAEHIAIEKVNDTNAAAKCLIVIRRTNTATSRADRTGLPFTCRIHHLVVRHDQVRLVRDMQTSVDGDTHAFEHGDLVHQCNGVDNYTVTDHTVRSRMQDTRWDQVKHILRAVEHDRVSSICTALIPRNNVGLLREHIDDLAFTFIAPLGANDDANAHEACSASSTVG